MFKIFFFFKYFVSKTSNKKIVENNFEEISKKESLEFPEILPEIQYGNCIICINLYKFP